jgi:putative two-component system response regulator
MREQSLKHARILVVDDEPANVQLLERVLERAGYTDIRTTTDSREVLAIYGSWNPDLVLLDLHMPFLDGFEIMEHLTLWVQDGTYVPLLVLTADVSATTRERALTVGAKDFLNKPFDPTEVTLRVKNLLETRFLHLELKIQNELLEEKVSKRTEELEEARVEILERLALAAEYRDDDTHEHTRRVGQTAALLARTMGIQEAEVELIRRSSPLHDVGKIGIPDRILLKVDKLTEEEFEVMKSHTTIGARMLSGSRFQTLRFAAEIALTHHERWDGGGYPSGLSGNQIPLAGRIVALVDSFDALTHDRPYKKAWVLEEAVNEIKRQRSEQFDPRVVDTFLELWGGFSIAGDSGVPSGIARDLYR